VLSLRAGARIVYKSVDRIDERVSGHGTWWDIHTALTVRAEEFLSNYRRMWEGIPEEAGYKGNLNLTVEEQETLPARTGLHRSPVGLKWKEICDRGDEFFDWDCHSFHFMGGKPLAKNIPVGRAGRVFSPARRVGSEGRASGIVGRLRQRKSVQCLRRVSLKKERNRL
jgi:hypothetical protein